LYWSSPEHAHIHVGKFISKVSILLCFALLSAIGVGAVQANMAVFGAEQMQESNIPTRYFDKYIVAVNIGGIFATILIPYIQVIQQDPNRFFHGYLVAASLLIVAIILFIGGYRCRLYIHIEPHDTIITKCIPVIYNAFQTRRKYKADKESIHQVHRSSSRDLLIDSTSTREERSWKAISEQSTSFLDFARASNNGKYVDRIVNDVKSLRRVIIVFLFLIPYWLIYYQVGTI
jgi:dipeptide/tripeptide permease